MKKFLSLMIVFAVAVSFFSAADKFKLNKIVLAGGVAANSSLEKTLREACQRRGFEFYYPSKILCTDNAAMIACRGYYQSLEKNFADSTLNAVPNLGIRG